MIRHALSREMVESIFEVPTSCLIDSTSDDCISVGHKVILKKEKFYKIVTVQADKLEQCEKSKIRLNGAIGKPYESLFLIQGQDLLHITNRHRFEDFESKLVQEELAKKANIKDNRHLCANPENQNLTPEDISQLRAEGKTGAEIVGQLVENSISFQEKTVFSQAKYLKKKKKKHMETVTILKPNTRNLCELYAFRGIQKVLGLRVDTISFLLAHANVHSGANVLMHETCAGLLMGAVLERLGTEGCLLHFHHGAAPPRPESHGALPPEATRLIADVPLQEATALRITCNVALHAVGSSVGSAKKRKIDSSIDAPHLTKGEEADLDEEEAQLLAEAEKEAEKDAKAEEVKSKSEEVEMQLTAESEKIVEKDAKAEEVKLETEEVEMQLTAESEKIVEKDATAKEAKLETEEEMDPSSLSSSSKRPRSVLQLDVEKRRSERRQRLDIARTKLLYEPWNALLIASKFHPAAPTLTLMHFLCPGAPFAVYCQRMQPLVEVLNLLKKRGEVVMLELSEGWLRPYQVLPERTHPEMTLHGGAGGYVLTGYKACGPFGKSRTAESDYEEGLLTA